MNAALKESPVTSTAEHKHPLLDIVPIVGFRTFDDWLERWKSAKHQAEMLGLLHCLTEEDDFVLCYAEGVSYLLELADGYDSNDFTGPDEHPHDNRTWRARKAIAQKAFQVLCLRFFKGKTNNHPQPFWWWMVKDEALLQKALWFLRPKKRWQSPNYGFKRELTHPYDLFAEFLEEFPRLGWEFPELYHRYEDRWSNDEIRDRMVAHRPQFIEILERMHKLNWLSIQELDDASIKKLTEMALGQELSLPPKFDGGREDINRKPETLEEASLGGSHAAKILLLHRIAQKERARLAELYELEEQRRALDEKAKKLNKKK